MKVSDVPIFVDNIIIEPKSTSQQFVIYGTYDNSTEENMADESYDPRSSKGENVMITLDFSGLHEPRCQGVDSPGTENSDFELWSPHDDGRHGSNDKCFLGMQTTYIRRKQDSECFNGEDFERQIMRVPCLCTEADYECDMNYVKDKGGKCVEVQDTVGDHFEKHKMTEKEEDCAAEGFYYVSQGYRKIPGDACYGGVKLDPIRKPCNTFAFFSSLFTSSTLIGIAVVGGLIYYGWPIIEALILILPIPDPKSSIEQIKAFAGSATGFVKGQFSSKQSGPPADVRNQYTTNLEATPDAYIGDDDSDDDIGKPADLKTKDLDSDSDEKADEEMMKMTSGKDSSGSELIDLGESKPKAAQNIPKLSGPK